MRIVEECQVKRLNKEMFYFDFLHFKKYGISISGLRTGLRRTALVSDHEVVKLQSDGYDPGIFSESERSILTRIHDRLAAMTTKEVVELSHKEPAWLKNHASKSIIPYSEAYLGYFSNLE